MHKQNELDAKRDEKEARKAKGGMEKLALQKMIFHASKPIPDDDDNLITTRTEMVESYGELLDCSMVGQMHQHLDCFLNDKNDCPIVDMHSYPHGKVPMG
jgi:hypothetical protein